MTGNQQKLIQTYTLRNEQLEAMFTNVGAALVSLKVSDADGQKRDVVLGYDDLTKYTDNTVYFGALLGRFAGEIRPAGFSWKGSYVDLPKDEQGMHLHGGADGITFKIWDTDQADEDQLRFSVLSTEAASGYPGDVRFCVRYWLEESALCVEYGADSDIETPVNMTAHPYFNLNGHDSGDTAAHELVIHAQRYNITFGEELEKGREFPCGGTHYDFCEMREIGSEEYDLSYILDPDRTCAAELYCRASGIGMRLKCSQPCVQFYNACETDEIGKGGARYGKGSAVCLEPQHRPNCVNVTGVEIPTADDKMSYRHTIRYEFYAKRNMRGAQE